MRRMCFLDFCVLTVNINSQTNLLFNSITDEFMPSTDLNFPLRPEVLMRVMMMMTFWVVT
jgi:hypothetical protein